MIAITLPLSGRAHCLVSELPAFVDEVVFHQLLHWHHFYDKSTTDVGLVSDGLRHAFGWVAVVSSLFSSAQADALAPDPL
jgi:uncharacterized membrane protein